MEDFGCVVNTVMMVKLAGPEDLIYYHCTALNQRLLENLRLRGMMAFTFAEGLCPWFLQCSGCRFSGTGMNLLTQTSQAIQSLSKEVFFTEICVSVIQDC